jgi:hypothetical protein
MHNAIKKLIVFSLFLCCIFPMVSVHAQDTAKVSQSPFLRGVWLAQTSLSLSSNARSNTDAFEFSGNILSNYLLRLSSGSFVIDRLAVGLGATFTRSLTSEQFQDEDEQLTIGPWIRYYLSDNEKGSLYVGGSVNYQRLYQFREFDDPVNPIRFEVEGGGIGGELGMGASYLVSKSVMIDLFFGVSTARYDSTINDLVAETVTNDTFFRTGVNFFVGFGILLDDLLF